MEAVTAIMKNLLQNIKSGSYIRRGIRFDPGLIIGWGIWPVQWTDATPEVLRDDLQEDYLRMAIEFISTAQAIQQTALQPLE